ncbi:MAG: DUF177 domain-containing protein [Muribaculaceae bacterium]|nr:DUF177 domain-containing protein [Muribaculaceae bacterium]
MGKFAPYKIQLASLPDGKHEQDFECGTEFFKNMENPDVITSDVKVHMDLLKKDETYDCTFTCKGNLRIPCDRCLDPIDHEVDTTYHIIVKYGDDYNDESDELLVIPYSDSYLNVAYMLYDTIVLTIPIRHVHPMGKCNRTMLAALHKHRSGNTGDEEVDEALEEVDSENENGGLMDED